MYDKWQCTGVPGMRMTTSGIRTAKDTSNPRVTEKPISFGFEHKQSPCWICCPELEPCWFLCGGDLQPNKQTKFQFTQQPNRNRYMFVGNSQKSAMMFSLV